VTANTRFGTLVVPEENIIHLPAGLAGFPAAHRFVLLERSAETTLRWLQCLDPEGPTFLVVDPLLVDPRYPLCDVRRAMGEAGLLTGPDDPLAVAAVVAVPPDPDPPTANLLAPIAVQVESRRGAQVILHDSGYGTREPLVLR
jgi:flagellar assembly factor FliW